MACSEGQYLKACVFARSPGIALGEPEPCVGTPEAHKKPASQLLNPVENLLRNIGMNVLKLLFSILPAVVLAMSNIVYGRDDG